MALAGTMQQSLAGPCLQQHRSTSLRPAGRRCAVAPMAAVRKVNTFDEAWKKGVGSTGYFSEDVEKAPVNILRTIESKKLLSTAGKLKLLSTADKAGLSLSKLEELKLLSTAEKLGLLTLAENALTSDPGTVTASSIPFLLAAIGSLVFIPADSLPFAILHWGAFAASFTAFATLFAGGYIIAIIQAE